jgi:ribosome biogenesis GTPase
MLGVSGAGKSALTNALLGKDVITEGALSADGLRGAHTTTSRSVHLVPGGGVVIDTPGLRAFAVGTSDDALALAFADIEALAPSCRFRDCAHDGEPGCAVVDVVSAERLASYRRLQREAERHRARELGGAAIAERRRQERSFGRLTSEAQAHRRKRRGDE